jgi:general L-amino acid transport system substrate-binding protein
MRRKTLFLFTILLLASMILAACAKATPEPGEAEGFVRGAILQRVKDRGKVVCAGRTDLLGFGYLDDAGRNLGFDIDLCRAVAAAVLGDADAIEIVPIPASDRGPVVQSGEVDILTRNVTWTSGRDASWGNFTIIMFFDGQGYMVRKDSGIETQEDMDGASVCVTSGTTTEKNLASDLTFHGVDFEAVIFEDTASVYGAYEEGRCDVTTSDRSQLAAVRVGFADPEAHVILPMIISKEPLTPVVPHGDDQWLDIVKTVFFGLINAEWLGVTSDNVDAMMSTDNPKILDLLGEGADWGYSDLGLSADALANAIKAVGNYGELYDHYMGPNGIAFTLPRGDNTHWTNGGVLYAPPVK